MGGAKVQGGMLVEVQRPCTHFLTPPALTSPFCPSEMENWTESHLVEPRIAEFKAELPSVEEIEAFYGVDPAKISFPADRPYTWSNTLHTLDGVVSIGQGNTGVQLAGLKRLPQSKAKADFRLLSAGTTYRGFFPLHFHHLSHSSHSMDGN